MVSCSSRSVPDEARAESRSPQGLQRLLWLSDVAGAARLLRWWGKVGMSSGSQAAGSGCQHWGV